MNEDGDDERMDGVQQHMLVHTIDGSVWNTILPAVEVMSYLEAIQGDEDITVGIALVNGRVIHVVVSAIVAVEVSDWDPSWWDRLYRKVKGVS